MKSKNLGIGFGGGDKAKESSSMDRSSKTKALTMDLAYLEVIQGRSPGAAIPLNRVRLVLGRNTNQTTEVDMDLSCQELAERPVVSRYHAEISWEDGRLLLRDLGSKNGTFVNGQQIPSSKESKSCPPIELALGDTIGLANLAFEVKQS